MSETNPLPKIFLPNRSGGGAYQDASERLATLARNSAVNLGCVVLLPSERELQSITGMHVNTIRRILRQADLPGLDAFYSTLFNTPLITQLHVNSPAILTPPVGQKTAQSPIEKSITGLAQTALSSAQNLGNVVVLSGIKELASSAHTNISTLSRALDNAGHTLCDFYSTVFDAPVQTLRADNSAIITPLDPTPPPMQ